jgi:putative addiction module component (TIGR02574 family)
VTARAQGWLLLPEQRSFCCMRNAAELRQELMALSADERAELALALIESLDDPKRDEGYEQAWAQEISGRLAALDAGTMTSSPAAEVFQRVRNGLAALG